MGSMKLSFKDFKKIKEDDHTATLLHPRGHEIKIAKKVLDSGLKKQLAALPMSGVKKMANGGGVGESDSAPTQPENQTPLEVEPISQDQPQTVDQEEEAPDESQGNTDPGPSQAPEQPQTQATPGQTAPQAPVAQPTFEDHKQDAFNQLSKEDQAWQHDLVNGHVTPKTYHDLFEDKSTLGKIGTIFGLMVGSGGAAMAHQTPALMAMMDNQIKNDLDAQKQSKENARNYLSLGQQALVNQAQAGAMNMETQVKGKALANMQMNRSALAHMVQTANSYPEGSPMRQQAQQTLGMMYNAVNNENFNIADRAASAAAYYKMMGLGSGSSDAGSEQAFQNKTDAMNVMGGPGADRAKYLQERHLPGAPGQASRPIPEDSRARIQAMNVLDQKGKDVLSFINKNTGTWNPQTRAVAQQKIEEMKNFYNDSIKGGSLTQGRLGWYDEQFAKNPTDIFSQLLGSTAKLKEMVNSNATRRDSELKSLGFPIKETSAAQGSSVPLGTTGTYNNRPVVMTNSGWKYK